ncbi:MAG: SGNH/GDSL hydrolase family protein [Lentisphaeria bacterium]|nr:SGNH/GDSL hydrolase family protein [Lentisphaeria bacterium]
MKFNGKFFVSAAAGALLLASGGCCITGKCPLKETPKCQIVKEDVNLLLPEKIYAVPGVETNVYFENIVRVINPDNYIFEARAPKGRWDEKRWSFTPTDKDTGSFTLTINVIGNQGLLTSKKVTVVVSPRNAGAGKNLSVLVIGDSLTNATVYPTQIHSHFKKPGNPKLKMIGSHAGSGRVVKKDGVAHEGYGGWAWSTFSTKWTDDAKFAKLTKRRDIVYARSPFLAKKDGKVVFDLPGYFKRLNNGKAPDIITFQLGVNDVFSANDANVEKVIDNILKNMDKLLSEMRKAAPDAVFGVGLTTAGCFTQDGFGKNYAARHSRWQYKKNQHRLVERMMQKFAKNNPYNVQIVPVYLNLDCENNFPLVSVPVNAGNRRKITRLNNGVHPSADGYRQIGDTFYCWMKAVLAQQSAVKK